MSAVSALSRTTELSLRARVLFEPLPPTGDKTSQTSVTSESDTATSSTGETSPGSTTETTGEPSYDWLWGPFYTPYALGGVDGQNTLSQIWFYDDGTAKGTEKLRCTEEVVPYDFIWVPIDNETVQLMPVVDKKPWFFNNGSIQTVYVERSSQAGQVIVSSPDGALEWEQPLGIYQSGEGCLIVFPEGADCADSTWAVAC